MNYLENLVSDLCKMVSYREDGNLVWIHAGSRCDLNGKVVGTVSKTDGYRYVKFRQKRILVHRVVFYIHHQFIPDEIDHINRKRDDNRIENLRVADTHSNNLGNQSIQARNKSSKYKGVCWDKSRKKWMAGIKHNGKRIYIGRFESEQLAAKAYNEYAIKIFGDFANTNKI